MSDSFQGADDQVVSGRASPDAPDKIVAQYRALVQRCTHLQFAVNAEIDKAQGALESAPEIAHVPFWYQPKNQDHKTFLLYVLGSMLSSASRALYRAAELTNDPIDHTKKSRDLSGRAVSLLLLDQQQQGVDPYAQARVTFTAQVSIVPRETAQWGLATAGLAQRHGDIVHTLTALQDFHCFALRPFAGRFVKGFGKAFELSGENLQEWTHLRQS